jgi:heptosyltransferase-2
MKECAASHNEKKRHHVHGALKFLDEMTPNKHYLDEDLVFDLRPGQDAEDWAALFIKKSQLAQCNRLIAVAPGSIQPHKRWPLESFKHLLSSLMDQYEDARFLVIGTPADKEMGIKLAEIAPQKIQNLAGINSISQSAALLKKCHLLVGNDGGAMHLGDAMGCKVVSIVSGIEYPNSIEPWHNKDLAIRWPVECAPCYSFVSCPKGHNKCMNLIPVSLVLEKCLSVL